MTIKDKKLGLYCDYISGQTLVAKTSEITFARINKVTDHWMVYIIPMHECYDTTTLRQALVKLNEKFTEFYIARCG